MSPDAALLACCVSIAAFAVFPVLETAWRRRASRESGEVAGALLEFARQWQEGRGQPIDQDLLERARRLGVPEVVTFEFVQQQSRAAPDVHAQTARRLALRLKRRVAFERKMLARTAPGRRRGAIAMAAPGLAILGLRLGGLTPPLAALALLVVVELVGCWLSWRVARIEV
ncbi:MAG TPA: hypothetical protein VFP37_16155 [Steroidobacteraceae bacterium]|nr:hypothetical protein [Steroidobacteraceae bacterium]